MYKEISSIILNSDKSSDRFILDVNSKLSSINKNLKIINFLNITQLLYGEFVVKSSKYGEDINSFALSLNSTLDSDIELAKKLVSLTESNMFNLTKGLTSGKIAKRNNSLLLSSCIILEKECNSIVLSNLDKLSKLVSIKEIYSKNGKYVALDEKFKQVLLNGVKYIVSKDASEDLDSMILINLNTVSLVTDLSLKKKIYAKINLMYRG